MSESTFGLMGRQANVTGENDAGHKSDPDACPYLLVLGMEVSDNLFFFLTDPFNLSHVVLQQDPFI